MRTRILMGLMLAAALAAYALAEDLPESVRKRVEASFAGAKIAEVGVETEDGVRYYELELALDGGKIEVEIDALGNVGEVERVIPLEEAPAPLRKAVREATGGKGKVRIERHERWGVGKDGRFKPLDKPRVFYEVKFGGPFRKRTIEWQPGEADLPEAARMAVDALHPRGIITEVEREEEDGLIVYDVALIENGADRSVEVTADGTVIESEEYVRAETMPDAVQATLKKLAGDARIGRIERANVRAEVDDGKIKPLDTPAVQYDIELRKGTLRAEVGIAADGRVLEKPEWKPVGEDEDDD